MIILIFSGYITKHALDYFVNDGSTISSSNFEKKLKLNKNFVSEGIYKNEQEISEEYDTLKPLDAVSLSNHLFFPKNKNFYI